MDGAGELRQPGREARRRRRRSSRRKRRSLADRPFVSWDDAFEVLAEAAETEPVLLVLDEFPELLHLEPGFPEELRALWDRLVEGSSNLKLILVGSAVRAMEAIQAEHGALYGRMSLRLLVHPLPAP